MQPPPSKLDINEATVVKALEEVRNRIVHFEHDRKALDRTIEAAREEEQLLLRVLALRRGDVTDEAVGSDRPGVHAKQNSNPKRAAVSANDSKRPAISANDSKQPAVNAVIRELASATRPLHISELMRILQKQGIEIPGAGSQANLISHLRRDPRLVRTSRGMYALAAWGIENEPIKVRRTMKKRRVRSKSMGQGD